MKSIFAVLGLPQPFGVVILTFSLILLVGPYLSGMDFGIFKVPSFNEKATHQLRIIGPTVFVLVLLLFIPIRKQSERTNIDLKEQLNSSFSLFEQYLRDYETNKGFFFRGVLQPLLDPLGSPIKEKFKERTVEALLSELIGKLPSKQAKLGKQLKDIWDRLVRLDHKKADDDMSWRGELVNEARTYVQQAKDLIAKID